MFYSLNGILLHKDTSAAVIECGGVGYRCMCSFNTLRKLPPVGEQAFLFTALLVRDDAMELLGFSDLTEKDCYRLLTSVPGVGSKMAISLLSELTPDQFSLCVASGDYKRLQRAQGVGQKMAQRIVLDLKDKVGGLGGGSEDIIENMSSVGSSVYEEAIDALVSLGYGRSDAAAAVGKLDAAEGVEKLIKTGLRELAAKL